MLSPHPTFLFLAANFLLRKKKYIFHTIEGISFD